MQSHIEEADDIGDILRTLRENQGFSLAFLASQLSIKAEHLSLIERSEKPLPSQAKLGLWLDKLGCVEVKPKIMLMAKQTRLCHEFKLISQDRSNNDIVRVVEAFKSGSLSEMDRDLLSIIARK